MMEKKLNKIVLICIICIGLLLRLYGIRWGLFNDKYFHGYSFHPDEQFVIDSLRNMDPAKFNFKPHGVIMWSKGTLVVYLAGIAMIVASLFKILKIEKDRSFFKMEIGETYKLYLVSRMVTVFFGVLSIFILYIIGSKIYNKSVGLLSALFLAVVPVHVVNSHYLATDVIMCFWILLVFLISIYLLDSDNIYLYFLSGFVIGIAIATKYNSGASLVIPITAHFIKVYNRYNFRFDSLINLNLLLVLVAAFLGFIICSPYHILAFSEFKNGLTVTYECVLKDLVPAPTGSSPGQPVWLFYFTNAFLYGVGLPLSILYIGGIIWSFIKRQKVDIIILIWLLTWWVVLALPTWKLVRWIIPLIPFLCLITARFIAEVFSSKQFIIRLLTILITTIVASYTFLYSAACSKLMSEKNIQDKSSDWIVENIRENSTIGVPRSPFVWDPSILQTQYFYSKYEFLLKDISKYNIVILDGSIKKLKSEKPDYIAMNDYFYHPFFYPELKKTSPERLEFLNYIMTDNNYELVKKFEKKPNIFGIYPIGGFFPHDWRYICPTILIYRRIRNT